MTPVAGAANVRGVKCARAVAVTGLLLVAFTGCREGDRPVRGVWIGHVRAKGVPAVTRVHVDGAAECLLLRHRSSALRLRVEGSAAAGPVVVRIAGMDHGAPRPVSQATLSADGGAFRRELRFSSDELGAVDWLRLSFDQAGLAIETLEIEEEAARKLKLVVLGLDGLSWRILDPLLKAGRLPHIDALVRGGVRGTLLSIKPMLSPVVWTTIATGHRPKDHKIWDFVDAEQRLVNSTQVRAKRIWEIASERQVATVGVVGWFVTWPVGPVAGFMLSDRSTPWKSVTGKERPLSFFPAALQDPFEDVFRERRARYRSESQRFASLPVDTDWRKQLSPDDPLRARLELFETRLLRAYLRDSTLAEAGLHLLSALSPDLFFLYLRGSDHAQHAFWFARAPGESVTPVDPDDRRYYGGVIDAYYVYLDEVLGRYQAAAPEDTVFMIVSDHGFRSYVHEKDGNRRSQAHHEQEGVYIVGGPGFRHGVQGNPISVLDLVPLWLDSLDLPVAADMPGSVPTQLLSEPDRPRPARIAGYGRRDAPSVSRAGEADADLLEQFKALGYVAE